MNNPAEIIRLCHLEVLNREPDDDGLNHYLSLFEKDQMDEKKLRDQLRRSKEYLNKNKYFEIIKKCYKEILNREPDDDGLKYFTGLFDKHVINEKKLCRILKSSNEYLIATCYQEIFGREIDESNYKIYYDMM